MDPDYSALLNNFIDIGIALALGLLIGSERGWHDRVRAEGERAAGIRTFAALSLLGGIVATGVKELEPFYGWLICSLAFLPVATLLIVSYRQGSIAEYQFGITTEVAAMVTYWLGILPAFGLALPAAASAVILAMLLHFKGALHQLLADMDKSELAGTLQFLLVSVVLLPLLPNEGFGPWQAFNPFRVWWMVVLISGLSLVGYFAMRVTGPGKGVLTTSITGGLVSSTAVTLSLSRLHRDLANTSLFAAGIMLACSIMFARVLILVAIIRLPLLPALAIPMITGSVSLLLAALWFWWQRGDTATLKTPKVKNPFQLIPALQFGALLAVVMLAAEALQQWFGHYGVYLLSVFTGIADVDPIVLSVSPKADAGLPESVAIIAIGIASATNTLVKAVYCRCIAGPGLGNKVLPAMTLSALMVVVTAWLGPVVIG